MWILLLLYLGAAGYVYIMTNIDGIFYARQVGLIMLPKSRSTFVDLLETLDLLFAFESFMVDLGQEAQAAMERRESLDNICEVANVIQETVPSIDHDIFITPSRPKWSSYYSTAYFFALWLWISSNITQQLQFLHLYPTRSFDSRQLIAKLSIIHPSNKKKPISLYMN